MIMTEEQTILKGQMQFDQMVEYVRQAARDGRGIDEVERSLWTSLLALGHTLLEGYVRAQGTGDMGATLEYGHIPQVAYVPTPLATRHRPPCSET